MIKSNSLFSWWVYDYNFVFQIALQSEKLSLIVFTMIQSKNLIKIEKDPSDYINYKSS